MKQNKHIIIILVGLIFFINLHSYVGNNDFFASITISKKQKSTSSNESNSTNSNDSNILDEDETNEVEFHPNFIIAHFSYLNVALFSKDKILRQSYNEPFLCNASQPPFYLLNRLLRL